MATGELKEGARLLRDTPALVINGFALDPGVCWRGVSKATKVFRFTFFIFKFFLPF